MRIVITGASGNFGTALLRQLTLDSGDQPHDLIGVSRRRPPATAALRPRGVG